VGHFQSTHQYDKFIKEAEKEYDLKIYRLSSFSREYAFHIHQELLNKYYSVLRVGTGRENLASCRWAGTKIKGDYMCGS
jgi:hypothetical protein